MNGNSRICTLTDANSLLSEVELRISEMVESPKYHGEAWQYYQDHAAHDLLLLAPLMRRLLNMVPQNCGFCVGCELEPANGSGCDNALILADNLKDRLMVRPFAVGDIVYRVRNSQVHAGKIENFNLSFSIYEARHVWGVYVNFNTLYRCARWFDVGDKYNLFLSEKAAQAALDEELRKEGSV